MNLGPLAGNALENRDTNLESSRRRVVRACPLIENHKPDACRHYDKQHPACLKRAFPPGTGHPMGLPSCGMDTNFLGLTVFPGIRGMAVNQKPGVQVLAIGDPPFPVISLVYVCFTACGLRFIIALHLFSLKTGELGKKIWKFATYVQWIK